MRLVTRKHLEEAIKQYPDASNELSAWAKIVKAAKWFNFNDLRQHFPDADDVDGYVVFNIRHNRYRLITVMHYCKQIGERVTTGVAYIRSFLTHKEYNSKGNWDKEHGE
jgi:mRNA interferase HigB